MPQRLNRIEFVTMMAMLFSLIAFSIDAMLPALPEIADALTPDDPNRAQLVLTSFVLGMGIGTFITGPLSDAYGRKPVMLAGAALYMLGTALAWAASSLELLLLARLVAGLGAAGPRVVGIAIVRDLYSGRQMAKIVSFIMIVFTLVPALAPSLGAVVIVLAGWRAVFLALLIFAAVGVGWAALRQAETLPPEARRPLRIAQLLEGALEIFRNRQAALAMAVQALAFGLLFGVLSTTQPIFDVTFGRGASFPLWFGGIALVAGTASLFNAAFVERLGMRRIITSALAAQTVISLVMCVVFLSGSLEGDALFFAFVFWVTTIFFQTGLTIGNLNALALEPLGHLAGMAASLVGAVSTVGAVILAIPLGLAFNGTPVPLAVGAVILSAVGLLLMRLMPRSDGEV